MIEASLRAHLGQFRLSADIKGEGITCIAGRNGSGKTTLLRTISGLVRIDDGFVRVRGTDVTRLPVEKRGIVLVTPSSFFPHLAVDQHITWGARLRGRVPAGEEVSKVKSALGIDFGGSVRHLSMGMRERVALATSLLARPEAILVDEAFSNLHDREDFVLSYGKLAKDAGIDLVFASQDEADGELADRTYLMSGGTTRQL